MKCPVQLRGWFPGPRGSWAFAVLPGMLLPRGRALPRPAGQASNVRPLGYVWSLEMLNFSSSGLFKEMKSLFPPRCSSPGMAQVILPSSYLPRGLFLSGLLKTKACYFTPS